jgi:hypothetical protein
VRGVIILGCEFFVSFSPSSSVFLSGKEVAFFLDDMLTCEI